ncbi:MAG TPA: T9SS type A sorting domain-containing protein, partial [Bacteroidota bacterium]|nr:T9SS type A sorting domain-containing protein [Bacteroidota bacterium]
VTNLPKTFMLNQNYPNPFNPSTIISYTVPSGFSKTMVSLKIYNINGQMIKELLHQELSAGKYLTKWDGTTQNGMPAASGIYFVRMIAGSQQLTKKMTLLK